MKERWTHLPAVDMSQTEMGSELAGRFQRDVSLAADKLLEHRGGNTARLGNYGQRFSTGGGGPKLPGKGALPAPFRQLKYSSLLIAPIPRLHSSVLDGPGTGQSDHRPRSGEPSGKPACR